MTEAARPAAEVPLPEQNAATPDRASDPSAAPSVPPSPAPGLPSAAATLRIFGALLWVYVVLGEWVIGLSFPEPLAVLILAGVLGLVWFTCVGHGTGTRALDRLLPGVIAISLWVLLLVLSSALPQRAEPSRIEAVSASLCFIGAAAFYAASLWRPPPVSTSVLGRQRLRWLGPIVAAAGTLLAIVSALSRI